MSELFLAMFVFKCLITSLKVSDLEAVSNSCQTQAAERELSAMTHGEPPNFLPEPVTLKGFDLVCTVQHSEEAVSDKELSGKDRKQAGVLNVCHSSTKLVRSNHQAPTFKMVSNERISLIRISLYPNII